MSKAELEKRILRLYRGGTQAFRLQNLVVPGGFQKTVTIRCAAVPGLVILLISRKRLGPLKGRLAVNRIRI